MTATDTELALLQSILLNPDDDVVRLVYADWLQEQGQDERAEFIRGQVALRAGMKKGAIATKLRGRRLLDRYKDKWCGFMLTPAWVVAFTEELVPVTSRCGVGHAQVNRGFIESLVCTTEQFLAVSPLLHWHPVESVVCPDCIGESANWQRHTYCPTCGNETRGRVQRPVPSTAQPLRRVRLTTPLQGHITRVGPSPLCSLAGDPLSVWFPESVVEAEAEKVNWNWERALLRLRFPLIEFELVS